MFVMSGLCRSRMPLTAWAAGASTPDSCPASRSAALCSAWTTHLRSRHLQGRPRQAVVAVVVQAKLEC